MILNQDEINAEILRIRKDEPEYIEVLNTYASFSNHLLDKVDYETREVLLSGLIIAAIAGYNIKLKAKQDENRI